MGIQVEELSAVKLIQTRVIDEDSVKRVHGTKYRFDLPSGETTSVKEILETPNENGDVTPCEKNRVKDLTDAERQKVCEFLEKEGMEVSGRNDSTLYVKGEETVYTIDGVEPNKYERAFYLFESDKILSYDNVWGLNAQIGYHVCSQLFPDMEVLTIDETHNCEFTPFSKYLIGKFVEEDGSATLHFYKVTVVNDAVYAFMGGRGTDGGFGDYAPPWFGGLLCDNGEVIYVKSVQDASRLVKEVENFYSDEFYSKRDHDSYDGRFPYEIRSVSIPDTGQSTVDYDTALELLKKVGVAEQLY